MSRLCQIVLLALLYIHVKGSESPSVLILGAGPSGIAAAARLLANNITNVKILEANDRIGGRIHSVHFGDAIVDLGAEWCHGETNNTVYELVKDMGLLEHDNIERNVFYSSGQILDEEIKQKIEEIFVKYYYSERNGPDTTIGEYFSKHYTDEVLEVFKSNKEQLAIALDAYHLFNCMILSNEGAFSSFDVSYNNDFIESEGDHELGWKGKGYKTILDVLIHKYPNPQEELAVLNKTALGKKVIQITWDSNTDNCTEVLVKCADSSEYHADHVIVTFSLGVLKESYETLFNPPLPMEKVTVIKELGMGAVAKIFFNFPNRWWEGSNYSDFYFVWSKKDREDLWNLTSIEESKMWLLDFMGLHSLQANPHVLSGWFTGSMVKEIELYSDEKIIDGLMFVLDKFLGHLIDNITPPDTIIRHKWYSDPYFRGSYSYETLESGKRNVTSRHLDLSKPVISNDGKQTLLFAGEATHPHFYSTVHGAIDTGRREADRIINLHK